jgi:hypothetical protein
MFTGIMPPGGPGRATVSAAQGELYPSAARFDSDFIEQGCRDAWIAASARMTNEKQEVGFRPGPDQRLRLLLGSRARGFCISPCADRLSLRH